MKNNKDSRITIRLDEDTRKKLDKLCDKYERTVSDVVRDLIEMVIERDEKE